LTETAGAATGLNNASFTIMTYNIRVDVTRDSAETWALRREDVIGVIDFYDADILCVQEALHNQMMDIARLSQYAYTGCGRDDGDTDGEYAGIFYRSNRYTLNESGKFWLSPTPEKPSFGWGSRHRRMASWAKLTDKLSGKALLVLCTHLDHEFEEARTNGATVLLEQIAALDNGSAVVLTGDFNETPDSSGIQKVLTEFRDSRAVSVRPAIGPDGTYNDFDPKNVAPESRIDYIFVKGGVAVEKQANIVTITPDGRLPSDHFPAFAELVIV
jgi:endonuclease/exonuclease/phosphatase family metal-dependent hydrolase